MAIVGGLFCLRQPATERGGAFSPEAPDYPMQAAKRSTLPADGSSLQQGHPRRNRVQKYKKLPIATIHSWLKGLVSPLFLTFSDVSFPLFGKRGEKNRPHPPPYSTEKT